MSRAIEDHVIRDLADARGEPLSDRDRQIVHYTINALFALGYIPNNAGMIAAREAHVSKLKAAGVPDEAIG